MNMPTRKILTVVRNVLFEKHADWLAEVKLRGLTIGYHQHVVDESKAFQFDAAYDDQGSLKGACFIDGPEFGWLRGLPPGEQNVKDQDSTQA